eukprot:Pgem_evm1s9087
MEYVAINLLGAAPYKAKLQIVTYYNPPHNTPNPTFIKTIFKTKNSILMGDLNCHHNLWSHKNDTYGKSLHATMQEANLQLLPNYSQNTYYTHSNTKPSLLDLVICNDHTLISTQETTSDHIPIFFSYKTKPSIHNFSPKTQININTVSWSKVADQFENYPQFNQPITTDNELQGSIQHITDFINNTITQATSHFSKQLRNNTTNFHVLPKYILNKLKTAQHTKKMYQKYRTPELKAQFQRLNNEARREI